MAVATSVGKQIHLNKNPMIILNIDVTKIPKERIATNPNWKGKFLKLVLIDRPNEDSDGFIACSVSKEERANNVRGEIVGNFKDTEKRRPDASQGTSAPTRRPAPQQPRPQDPSPDQPADDIPF